MLPLNASSLYARSNTTGSPLAGPPMATPPPADNRDPAGFASLLRQTQAGPAVHAVVPPPEPTPSPQVQAAPEPTAKPEPANDTDATRDSASASQRANAAAQRRPRDGADAAAARRGAKPSTEAAEAGRGNATERDKRDTADNATAAGAANPPTIPPALDPAVLHWLAGQQRGGNAAAAAAADAPGLAPGDPTRAADAPGATPGGRGADLKADAALSAQAAQGKLQLGAATSEGGFGAVLAEQHRADKPSQSTADAPAGFKDIAAAAAALAPSATAPRSAAAPLAVAVATPVAAPEFARSLGLQLSVLARDGVQHAELHLNPADMGPVSVQIAIDGTQARVDFGADVAATRHAIEAGLPELASAMRDAGFTLAGGGVSQHSRGRGDGPGGGAPAGSGTRRALGTEAAERIDAAGRATRRTVRIGGLDLYA
ncbi:MAG: flagellar hook-length control protein FliK [Burkholderiales bacterium]|nr:flagellar hook-length control protein FliK [Burkholderiales bacterium]